MYVIANLNGKFTNNNEIYGHAFATTQYGRFDVSKAYTVTKETKDTKKPLYKGMYFGKLFTIKKQVNEHIEAFTYFKPIFRLDLLKKTYISITNDAERLIGYMKDLTNDEEVINYVAIHSQAICTELMRKCIRKNNYVTFDTVEGKTVIEQVIDIDKVNKKVTTKNYEINIYDVLNVQDSPDTMFTVFGSYLTNNFVHTIKINE